jgi:spectinomycin phosphotransferase
LKQIHAVTPAVSGLEAVRIETFNLNPRWLDTIQRIPATIDSGDFANPHQEQFAAFWQAKQAEITRIVDRAIQLGRWLQSQSLEKVLCHTDIHTANVLVEGTDKIHIVDWDSPLFAPRERDLMFMVEQQADDAAHFFEGYGQMPVNPLALAYYRYEWVVQEFGDFAERVFFMDDVGDETHADSVRGFKQLFDPGDVIAEAYKVESNLPATHRQHVWQTGIASRSGNGEGRG